MLIVLASVPAAHPYVDAATDSDAVELLGDPVPLGATLPNQWWPPRWLDVDYVRDHLNRIDVLHVHFGYDTAVPSDLDALVRLLAARAVPLVMTVHDLHNPHFVGVEEHRARLDVLVPAADAVITLTDGAAAEIAARWGRNAVVLPHPHVLPLRDVGTSREARAVPVVAVHAKGLRANIDPWPVLDALVECDRRAWKLRLDVDAEAMTSPRCDEVTERRLDGYRSAGVDVHVHGRFDDDELTDYLREVDVAVLPYRFGSHSGWVEACFDAGVQTVVPDCGYFHLQHPCSTFRFDQERCDADDLRRGVDHALHRVASAPVGADHERRHQRAAQRESIRRETVRLYRRVLADRAAA